MFGPFFAKPYFAPSYWPTALAGHECSATLSPEQLDLYRHHADIVRFTEVRTDGVFQRKAWSVIQAGVCCYFETGQSNHGPTYIILGEGDNIFTLDRIHMEAGVEIQSGDVLVQTEGPEAGGTWKVRGNPQVRSLMANKQMVLASREMVQDVGV